VNAMCSCSGQQRRIHTVGSTDEVGVRSSDDGFDVSAPLLGTGIDEQGAVAYGDLVGPLPRDSDRSSPTRRMLSAASLSSRAVRSSSLS